MRTASTLGKNIDYCDRGDIMRKFFLRNTFNSTHLIKQVRFDSFRSCSQVLLLPALFSLFIFATSATLADSAEENPLAATKLEIDPFRLQPQQIAKIKVTLHIKPGYTIYADSIRLRWNEPLSSLGFSLGQVKLRPVITFLDKATKKTKKGLRQTSYVDGVMEAPEAKVLEQQNISELEMILDYQACTESYCLLPQSLILKAPIQWAGITTEATKESKSLTNDNQPTSLTFFGFSFSDFFNKTKSQTAFQQLPWFILLFAMFILGLITSLTPCIYPLIPITVNVLSRKTEQRWQVVIKAYVYVLGLAITYSTLGVIAAGSGSLFGSIANTPWVLGIISMIFLLMALSSFGFFEISLPGAWQNRLQILSPSATNLFNTFIMGNISGLIAGPCVGPVLVAILTFIAQTKNIWLGFWSLFFFALGMGQLLIVIGLFGHYAKKLPRAGDWLTATNVFLGMMMLLAFYYYWRLAVPERLWLGSVGLGLIILGSILAFKTLPQAEKGGESPSKNLPAKLEQNSLLQLTFISIQRGLGFSGLFIGSFLLFWAIVDGPAYIEKITHISKLDEPHNQNTSFSSVWLPYSENELAQAIQNKQPILIDFYADWCASCLVMEKEVFSKPQFISAAQGIKLLRFDATHETPLLTQLKKRFNIVGLPTIIVFDHTGKQREDLEIVRETSLPEVLEVIKTLKNKN